jgi:putative ABC transport system permease protein
VLRTLGYPGRAVAWLVVSEGALLGLLGGVLGVGGAAALLRWQSLTLGSEGHTLAIRPDFMVILAGVLAAVLLGIFAALWPAWRALRQPIVASLRS